MSDDTRAVLLKLISEVEDTLATTRGVLSQPIDSATTLRCVELITSMEDTLKVLEAKLHELEQ